MTIPFPVSAPCQRLKEGAFGFAITVVPLAAIGVAQFLFARHTVLVVGGMNPDIDTWVVSQFRRSLLHFYAVVACFVATYWGLAAGLGRGQFLGVRSANVSLALSGLSFACAMAIASAVPAPTRLLKVACPYLDLSDTYPKFGFDNPSACEAFANAAMPLLLLGLPALLLVTSAILRISVSRCGMRTYVR